MIYQSYKTFYMIYDMTYLTIQGSLHHTAQEVLNKPPDAKTNPVDKTIKYYGMI